MVAKLSRFSFLAGLIAVSFLTACAATTQNHPLTAEGKHGSIMITKGTTTTIVVPTGNGAPLVYSNTSDPICETCMKDIVEYEKTGMIEKHCPVCGADRVVLGNR